MFVRTKESKRASANSLMIGSIPNTSIIKVVQIIGFFREDILSERVKESRRTMRIYNINFVDYSKISRK